MTLRPFWEYHPNHDVLGCPSRPAGPGRSMMTMLRLLLWQQSVALGVVGPTTASAAAPPLPLPKLSIDPAEISISGLSSGAVRAGFDSLPACLSLGAGLALLHLPMAPRLRSHRLRTDRAAVCATGLCRAVPGGLQRHGEGRRGFRWATVPLCRESPHSAHRLPAMLLVAAALRVSLLPWSACSMGPSSD